MLRDRWTHIELMLSLQGHHCKIPPPKSDANLNGPKGAEVPGRCGAATHHMPHAGGSHAEVTDQAGKNPATPHAAPPHRRTRRGSTLDAFASCRRGGVYRGTIWRQTTYGGTPPEYCYSSSYGGPFRYLQTDSFTCFRRNTDKGIPPVRAKNT